MRKLRFILPLFICFSLLLHLSCGGDDTREPEVIQTFLEASEIITNMGIGFNLGNTFDLNINSTNPEDIYQVIDFYTSAGMKHIRIPTTWMDGFDGDHLADNAGNVDFTHARFIQLKAVIDYALDKELYVVLNAHHERWLYEGFNENPGYANLFSRLWFNIAHHFKDYPQELIFEVLNEPQGDFG